MRCGDNQHIGLGQHPFEREQIRIDGDVRIGHEHPAGPEGEYPLQLVGKAGTDVVGAGLECRAEDPDRRLGEVMLGGKLTTT